MKQRLRYLFVVTVMGLGLLTACKPSVPSQYIQPDEMEEVLYDYYVGQGMGQVITDGDNDYQRRLYFNAMLKKHGLTEAEFDSSLVYYYTRADRFVKVYENVQKRLSDEALALGASERDVERYTSRSLSGDTMDIWEGKRQAVLMPKSPYHIIQFSQKADTAYRKGDSFLMTFNSTYLVQSGSRNSTAYLAVIFDNDSVVSHHTTISTAGNTVVRIPACDEKVREIRGYFYMAPRQTTDNDTDLKILLLDHIQLIRFHKKEGTTPQAPATPAAVQTPDTTRQAKPDSLLRPVHRLGERPQLNDNKHQLRTISR